MAKGDKKGKDGYIYSTQKYSTVNLASDWCLFQLTDNHPSLFLRCSLFYETQEANGIRIR
jgi:hypothetical protein